VRGNDVEKTSRVADEVLAQMAKDAALAGAFREDSLPAPQRTVDIDRVKMAQAGVPFREVASALGLYHGTLLVGPFRRLGHQFQVVVRGDSGLRDSDNLEGYQVRTAKGDLVPLSALVKVRQTVGPTLLRRLDHVRCVLLTARPARGVSDEEARRACRALVDRLRAPRGCEVEVLEPVVDRRQP
jgi:multidrug efflux pump